LVEQNPTAGWIRVENIGKLRADSAADARTPVLVLTYDYWQSHFGGDPSVVGRAVRMNEQAVTIIGVAAERFTGLESLIRVSGFVPLSALDQLEAEAGEGPSSMTARDRHALGVIGRLKPRVTIEQARAALAVKAGVLAVQYPATNKGVALLVVPETHARPVPQNGPMFHVAAAVLALLAAPSC
jgi:hypothetical protein